jgi:hypothetical protein
MFFVVFPLVNFYFHSRGSYERQGWMNGATGPRAAEPKGNGVRAVQSAGHASGKQPSSGRVDHGVVDLGFHTKVSRRRQGTVQPPTRECCACEIYMWMNYWCQMEPYSLADPRPG